MKAGPAADFAIPSMAVRVEANMSDGYAAPFREACKVGCGFLLVFAFPLTSLAQETDSSIPPPGECEPISFAAQHPGDIFMQEADFTPYAGMTIGTIKIVALNVFDETDPKENYLIYRMLNKIHYTTRASVIESQLLFSAGSKLEPRIIEESERLLRENHYMADARIVPYQQCGQNINLLVITRDIWSLEPSVKFSRSGGKNSSGFSLTDANIVGTGTNLSVSYTHAPERDSVDYAFVAKNMFGSRVETEMHYANASDGGIKKIDISQPFFSLDSRWTAGVNWQEESKIDTVSSGGSTLNVFRHDMNQYEAFGGFSRGLQNNFTMRYYFGITQEEDIFNSVDATVHEVPEDRKLLYPWFAFEKIENLFSIYSNLDFIHRTEDVPLGKNLFMKLGYGGSELNNRIPQWRFFNTYSDVLSVGEHHLLKFEGHFNGTLLNGGSEFENAFLGASTSYYQLTDAKNRWYGKFAVEAGMGLSEDKLLGLGGISDLRGYPANFQRGNRLYQLNIERRYFSDLHILNLIRAGGVLFFDAGRVWQSGQGEDIKPLCDVGFGLRLSSSKSHSGHVLHLDVAIPLNERQGIARYQWLLKTQQKF